MRILLVAPEICHPWTEGRKRFVRDLSAAFSRHHDVRVLTTTTEKRPSEISVPSITITCRSTWQHLTAIHEQLPAVLSKFKPTLVCHFPYGTFRHVYRMINLWSMRHIDRACTAANAPCFTIMYSISQEAHIHQLRPWVRHLVLNDFRSSHEDHVVRLGLDFDTWPEPSMHQRIPPQPRLLFIAGMWQPTMKRLEHVLRVRGLGLLLKAGTALSAHGMRLTVAVPLLADSRLQKELQQHQDNTWPATQFKLAGEARIPDIYHLHDLFVFPYMREETQFTPTSVVEAMRAGIPVVLPDLEFLRPLTGGGRYAYTFSAGDPDALARTVISALDNPATYNTTRRKAYEYVGNEMSIERSCEDILALYENLHQRKAAAS